MLWKDQKKEDAIKHLKFVTGKIEEIDEKEYDHEKIKGSIWDYADKEGRGDVLWPMRYALSGKERSPDPFSLALTLGKDEALERLKEALSVLEQDRS